MIHHQLIFSWYFKKEENDQYHDYDSFVDYFYGDDGQNNDYEVYPTKERTNIEIEAKELIQSRSQAKHIKK